MSSDEIRNKIEDKINEFAWASWANDVQQLDLEAQPSSSCVTVRPASDEAWNMVQTAYDAMTICINRTKDLCKGLVRIATATKSETTKRLIADATATVKEMERGISEFDDVMVSGTDTASDSSLRALLKHHSVTFAKLTEYEGELKALKKHLCPNPKAKATPNPKAKAKVAASCSQAAVAGSSDE